MSDKPENPMDPQHRLHELMGAAVLGSLTPAESEELEGLLDADPAARRELAELRATVAMLPPAGAGAGFDAQPSPGLEDRVVAAVADLGRPPPVLVTAAPPPARTRGLASAAAAAALVVVAGLGGWAIGQREPASPTGPPGTLGATETISFTGEPRGVEVDAAVVAHTWGTETVLTVDGLTQGVYTVQVIDTDGDRVEAGTFIAAEQGVTDCRMIAALLRSDAAAILVSEADGDAVMRSQLPQPT